MRHNKSDPLVDEVELIAANPTYARVRYPGGRETSVSLRDLAPCPNKQDTDSSFNSNQEFDTVDVDVLPEGVGPEVTSPTLPLPEDEPRRSCRLKRQPDRFGFPPFDDARM